MMRIIRQPRTFRLLGFGSLGTGAAVLQLANEIHPWTAGHGPERLRPSHVAGKPAGEQGKP